MTTHSLNLKKPLAFIDLETTGLNIVLDRIVEISIAKALPNGQVEIKTKRINPGIPIPIESSLIHGIYDEDVKEEPTFKQIAKSLTQFLQGCDLAGFNSNRFDIPLLVEEFLRVDNDLFEIKNRRLVDVQRIFHLMEPRTLAAAYKFYCNQELEGAHSAEVDTLATLAVLDAQIKRYEDESRTDEQGKVYHPITNDVEALHQVSSHNLVDFAQRFRLDKKGEVVFNFGKYNGQKVKEVLKREPQYYDWMINGQFPLDTKRKLTEIKIQLLSES